MGGSPAAEAGVVVVVAVPEAAVVRGALRPVDEGVALLAVDDAAPFQLEVRQGAATVLGDSGATPVRMSLASLASVAYGGLPLESASRLGWTEHPSLADLRRVGSLLRVPAFFSVDAF